MNVSSLSAARVAPTDLLPWSAMMAPPEKQISTLEKQIKTESISSDDPSTKLAVTQELQTQLQALQHQAAAQNRIAESRLPQNSEADTAFRIAVEQHSPPGTNLNLKL